MTGVLTRNRKGEDRDTQKGKPCEDGGRDWNDVSTSQGTSKVANSHQKPGESHGKNSPSEPLEGNNLDVRLLAS